MIMGVPSYLVKMGAKDEIRMGEFVSFEKSSKRNT